MMLEAAAFVALAAQCSPTVAPDTLLAIAGQESELHVYLVHDNTTDIRFEAETVPEAVAKSRSLLARGHSLDLGLMQINSRNLGWLGVSLEDVFEPCTNVAAGGKVLERAYRDALAAGASGAPALKMALSAYNTGDALAGVANGYVQQVELRATQYVVPSLGGLLAKPATSVSAGSHPMPTSRPSAPTALAESAVRGTARSSDVFARKAKSVFSQGSD
jgi:type IV secretion system protein VirB1